MAISKGSKPDKLMRDALSLELHREVPDPEDGDRGNQIKKLRLVARAMVGKAIAGDVPASKEIFDRMDGKLVASHEFSGVDGAPIEVADMTPTAAARRIAFALARGRRVKKDEPEGDQG